MFLLFQKAQAERLLIEGESAIEGIDEFGRGSCALFTSSVRGHYGLQAIRWDYFVPLASFPRSVTVLILA